MKNLMAFVSPDRNFRNGDWGNEAEALARIQIDNSLELGWRREDLILATNFDWRYNGIDSVVVGDDMICPHSVTAGKVNVILELFDRGIIDEGLYWFHDLDAFQLEGISYDEVVRVLAGQDLGLTDYGKSSINEGRDLRWSTGTLFFKKPALDIFQLWRNEVYKYKANEEIALLEMLKKGRYRRIKERIQKVNITYNLATRRRLVAEAWAMADKPLKVLHFHPFDKRPLDNGEDNMAYCVYGRNPMGHPLIPKRLARIFKDHGIE